MGDMERNTGTSQYAKQIPALREMVDIIREENAHYPDEVDRVVRILGILAEESGTTIQDALDLLEEVKKTLLQYQRIS